MENSDTHLVLLSPEDNCLVVAQALREGDTVTVEGERVAVTRTIGVGHKLARRAIRAGEKVLKYGAVIGTATADIGRGEHVHTHNLESDYLPTYTHDAGKSFVTQH
jgi:altronate dehydratase small subunit